MIRSYWIKHLILLCIVHVLSFKTTPHINPLLSCVIRTFRTLKDLNKDLLDQAPDPSFTLHTNAMVKKIFENSTRLGVMGTIAKLNRKRHGQTDRQTDRNADTVLASLRFSYVIIEAQLR